MALPPLGELGWQGVFQHDSPEVVALRETMDAEARASPWAVESF
jgi:hypothetical protein